MTAVRADGRELPFEDGEFDLGFSNAVIEHVAGGRAGQRQFISELCRVAGKVFVTTPNKLFPVDPHSLLPFVHWLPEGEARARALRARGFDDVLDPLGPRELAALFPYPVTHRQPRDDARRRRSAVKRPVWILHVFVVGLALHNFAMAELYAAGVRGNALDVVSAWKEVLLALGLLLVWRDRGWSLTFRPGARRLARPRLRRPRRALRDPPAALARRRRDPSRRRLGVRHDLLPVAAYFFGRGLDLSVRDARKLGVTVIASASAVAAFGLIDVYAIPLSWWRSSGAPDWFRKQLGFTYKGLSNLPQNFVYNTGNGHPSSGGSCRCSSRRSRLVHVRDGASPRVRLEDPAPAEAAIWIRPLR